MGWVPIFIYADYNLGVLIWLPVDVFSVLCILLRLYNKKNRDTSIENPKGPTKVSKT
jgi:hypothetical protein